MLASCLPLRHLLKEVLDQIIHHSFVAKCSHPVRPKHEGKKKLLTFFSIFFERANEAKQSSVHFFQRRLILASGAGEKQNGSSSFRSVQSASISTVSHEIYLSCFWTSNVSFKIFNEDWLQYCLQMISSCGLPMFWSQGPLETWAHISMYQTPSCNLNAFKN